MMMVKRQMTIIHSWDEVPAFSSEAEESEWWGSHGLGEELLNQMQSPAEGELPPPRPRTRSITLRVDEVTLRRIKALAARQHTGYQTLLKKFVTERLYEEEKREGLV
jgi:hypothetical protein